MSSGSFGFVWFVRARPTDCQVHSGSLGSFRRTLGVFGFVWFIWARAGGRRVHWGSSCSFMFVWFIRVCHWDRPGLFGSFGPAPGVDWFRHVRLLNSGEPRGSPGTFGFVRFIHARSWCGRVHSGSFGSFGFVWFIRALPGGHRVRLVL